MTAPTVRDIITGAIVELGALALGDTPPAEEADRGLTILQALYLEAVENGKFGRVTDYLATDDYEAEEQQRVFADGFTITLPDTVEDEIDLEDRKPRDLAMIQVVDDGADPQISIYDAHQGAWVRLDSLTLNSDAPLAQRNRHGFECALARRLASSLQRPVPQGTDAYANGLSAAIANRYSAPRTTTQPDYF